MSGDPRKVRGLEAPEPVALVAASARMRATLGVAFKPANTAGNAAISLAIVASVMLLSVFVFGPKRTATPGVESTFLALFVFGLLLAVGSIAAFGGWLQQAYRNLLALGNEKVSFPLSLVVWSCIVPVVNHIIPFLLLIRVWNGSDPKALFYSRKETRLPPLVLASWLCFGAALLIDILFRPTKLQDLTSANQVLRNSLRMAGLVVAVVVILQVNRMQAERIALVRKTRNESDYSMSVTLAEEANAVGRGQDNENSEFPFLPPDATNGDRDDSIPTPWLDR